MCAIKIKSTISSINVLTILLQPCLIFSSYKACNWTVSLKNQCWLQCLMASVRFYIKSYMASIIIHFVNYMFHFDNGMFSLKYTVKRYNNGDKTAFNIVIHLNFVLKGIKTF